MEENQVINLLHTWGDKYKVMKAWELLESKKRQSETKKEYADVEKQVLELFKNLDGIEQSILIDKYINGMLLRELAHKYFYSVNGIANKLTRIYNKMKVVKQC